MADFVQNFKIIVAMKGEKDFKLGPVKCSIYIQDKVKTTVLPQSEGQFFDINELSLSNPIKVVFETVENHRTIGEITVPIPKDVYETKEVELADSFTLKCDGDLRFNGRYYIIILNKGEVRVEPQSTESIEEQAHQQIQEKHQARQNESPTRQFIKSTGERSHERTKKDQSKKLLAETKYDPKPTNSKRSNGKDSTVSLNKSGTFAAKKSVGQTPAQSKQINKYNSTKQIDAKKDSTQITPQKNQRTEQEESVDQIKVVKQQSPFSKYKGQSQQPTYYELESELDYVKGQQREQQTALSRAEGNGEINDRLENDLQESELKRADLQGLVREGIQEGAKLREEFDKKVHDLTQENIKLQKKLKAQTEKTNELEKDLDHKSTVIREQEQVNKDLQRKLKNQEEMKRICDQQQAKLEELEQRIKDNQKSYQDKIKGLVASISKLEGQHTQLLAEKADAELAIRDLRAQLQKQSELKQLEKLYQDEKARNNELRQHIEQLKNDILALTESQEKVHNTDADKIQALKEVIKGQDQRIKDLDGQVRQLQKQVLLLKEQVASLQLGQQLTQELVKQLEAFKRQNQELMCDNANLAETIDQLTDSLAATNNQILELRADVLNQTTLTEEAESNNNNLKRLILEMRERGVAYIPIKDDQIDQKLASFINSRSDSDQQRALFVREGEGVYQFGSKKIYIKVEQDKILIRSGGGYISIEEFLNLYSHREMDTMMRGDPLAALSRNKAALRKRDEMKLVNQLKDEHVSPLKKKGTSHLD